MTPLRRCARTELQPRQRTYRPCLRLIPGQTGSILPLLEKKRSTNFRKNIGFVMPWTYERNASLGVVEVVYKGEVSARELRESTSELIGLEKREGLIWFLVDVTEMTLSPFYLAVRHFQHPHKTIRRRRCGPGRSGSCFRSRFLRKGRCCQILRQCLRQQRLDGQEFSRPSGSARLAD